MDRREALKSVAFLMGGALSATTIGVFLNSCNSSVSNKNGIVWTADQQQMLEEIADIIIPATKTPGARAAGVGPFIAMMIKDCYPENAQNVFQKGLQDLEDLSKKQFGLSYLKILPEDRKKLMETLRVETIAAKKENSGKPDQPNGPYFLELARDLTILGYFTSEIGATQAYEYLHIPGRYNGCVDMKPGQRVWATN